MAPIHCRRSIGEKNQMSHLSCFGSKIWCLCHFILTLNWSGGLWGWNEWTYKWQKRLANNCMCHSENRRKFADFTLLTTFCCWACFCLKVATSLQSVSFSLQERDRKMKYKVLGNEFCQKMSGLKFSCMFCSQGMNMTNTALNATEKTLGQLFFSGWLRLHPHEASAFPIWSFFPLSQEISAYTRNHETNTKRCSKHARPVCGAVILPQRYTKNGEEDLDNAHKPCPRYTNENGTIHLLICVNVC